LVEAPWPQRGQWIIVIQGHYVVGVLTFRGGVIGEVAQVSGIQL
jgi:hypothetical protein